MTSTMPPRDLADLGPLPAAAGPLPVADPGPVPPPAPAVRVPVIGALPWDRTVETHSDLALFLGGSEDSYTGDLLRLIAKGDPGNRARLARIYPAEVLAWCIWVEFDGSTGAAAQTAAGLLGLMLITKLGGAHPGDPAGTIAAAEWHPATGGAL